MIDHMTTQDPKEDDGTARKAGVMSTRVCAIMLVLYAMYYARSLLIPVVTAIVLYLTLRPLVRQARRVNIPPALAAVGIIVGIGLMLAAGTYLVFQPAQTAVADAPRHLSVVKEKLAFVTDRLNDVDEVTEELAETEEEATEEVAAEKPVPVEIKQPSWTSGWSYLSGTGNFVSFLTICIALLYFLLATGDDLLRSIMRSLPDFTARRKLGSRG